ncbi:MAG TPA: aldose 1-epimerase [Bryobacteraceae bacterium]|nr:aldose 1-epimerase [Bryobacteraceae bacterium]
MHMRRFAMLLTPFLAHAAGNYTALETTDHGVSVVRLADAARGVEVSIVPSIGNRAYEMKVHGKNILYFANDVGAFKSSGGRALNGIPFLGPWANRMAGGAFWANGKKYTFNSELGTVRVGQNGIAIHGMLTTTGLWQVTEIAADGQSAHVTAKLEFWKHPELMANWPFAHEYEMTYRLADGALEVTTVITNLGAESMPVSIGYHPYFNLPDVARADSSAHIPARKHIETDPQLVSTGEMKPSDLGESVSLKDHTFDDGYTDLVRDASGRAVFWVDGGGKQIQVVYGPKYTVGVVYAPPNQNYICFEPMTAITNGVNLAHDGKYSELQSVAPGTKWHESFWVRTTGM